MCWDGFCLRCGSPVGQFGVVVLWTCSSQLQAAVAGQLVLELHSARTEPVISGMLIWCWLYLMLASTSAMPWSSALGGRGAVCVGVLGSIEAAFR